MVVTRPPSPPVVMILSWQQDHTCRVFHVCDEKHSIHAAISDELERSALCAPQYHPSRPSAAPYTWPHVLATRLRRPIGLQRTRTVASIRRHLCYPRTHALWQTSRPSCVAWCTMHVACRMLYFACRADQTSRTRQLDDRVDVARAASDVHGKDSLGLRRDHLCRQTELELCCTRQAPAKCDQEVPSQLSPP